MFVTVTLFSALGSALALTCAYPAGATEPDIQRVDPGPSTPYNENGTFPQPGWTTLQNAQQMADDTMPQWLQFMPFPDCIASAHEWSVARGLSSHPGGLNPRFPVELPLDAPCASVGTHLAGMGQRDHITDEIGASPNVVDHMGPDLKLFTSDDPVFPEIGMHWTEYAGLPTVPLTASVYDSALDAYPLCQDGGPPCLQSSVRAWAFESAGGTIYMQGCSIHMQELGLCVYKSQHDFTNPHLFGGEGSEFRTKAKQGTTNGANRWVDGTAHVFLDELTGEPTTANAFLIVVKFTTQAAQDSFLVQGARKNFRARVFGLDGTELSPSVAGIGGYTGPSSLNELYVEPDDWFFAGSHAIAFAVADLNHSDSMGGVVFDSPDGQRFASVSVYWSTQHLATEADIILDLDIAVPCREGEQIETVAGMGNALVEQWRPGVGWINCTVHADNDRDGAHDGDCEQGKDGCEGFPYAGSHPPFLVNHTDKIEFGIPFEEPYTPAPEPGFLLGLACSLALLGGLKRWA